MFRRTYRYLHLLIASLMLMQILLSTFPHTAVQAVGQGETVDLAPEGTAAQSGTANPATNWRQIAEEATAAQLAYDEPTPIDLPPLLPPGTVAHPSHQRATTYAYLPLVTGDGGARQTAVERIDLRTRTTKTFQRADGSGYALSYLSPVHFQAPDGAWQAIDSTFVAVGSGGHFRNKANDFVLEALPGDQGGAALQLRDHALQLAIRPAAAASVRGTAVGAQVTYAGAAPGVDLVYTAGDNGFDIAYRLERPAAAIGGLTMTLQVANGAVSDGDGYFTVQSPDTDPWFFSTHALAGDQTLPVAWELDPLGDNLFRLTIHPDSVEGLAPDSPLTILTTGTRNANRDAYAQSGFPTTPPGNQFNLYLGYDTWYGKGRTRIFARFDSPNLPTGTVINNARAYFYQYAVQAGSTYNARACLITGSWGEYTLTWNVQPGAGSCQSYVATTATVDWKYWTITSYARDWNNGATNNGIRLDAQNEYAAGGVFYSRDCVSQCPGGQRPYMWLDYTLNPALRLYDGVTLSPGSTVELGTTVAATYRVINRGGVTFNGQLRVDTNNGGADFPSQSVSIAANGGTVLYQQSQTFNALGTYTLCAQYYNGAWHTLTEEGSGRSCVTLTVVQPADVRLSSALSIAPVQLDHNGGPVDVSFTAQNYGGFSSSETFRVSVSDGAHYPARAATLAPGASYAYAQSRLFSNPGVYQLTAQHNDGSGWVNLIDQYIPGSGTGYVRVLAPPPPPVKEEKGRPPSSGNAGEPVNTATGNYYHTYVDLSDPTPGLSLQAVRWYNALDAADVPGPFGYGTSWEYGAYVDWRPDKSAIVHMGDGHQVYYLGTLDPNDPGNMAGIYVSQSKDVAALERLPNGSGQLTFPNQTVYLFDANGRLQQITTPYPASLTFSYDASDRLVQVAHSAGVTYTIRYSGNWIAGIDASSGRSVNYAYTPAGDLASVTRPNGLFHTYTYDANHRLTEGRDANNHLFVQNIYDAQGRVERQYDQTGQESSFNYDSGGLVQTYTDVLGHTITHTYDADYNLIAETNALGYTKVYTRNANGWMTAMRDERGHLWQYTYDAQGNLLSETDPLQSTWTYGYDAANNRTSQTNPLGQTWLYQYDADGRLLQVTDPLSHTHAYAYDALGNLIWEQDNTGAITEYAYNALGLQTVITNALGHTTQMTYDAHGNQTRYVDANGSEALFVYDAANRLIESIDPMNAVITFTYDAAGNLLTQSDGMGHVKTFVYDAHDRVIAETDFKGGITRYEYDGLGRLTVVTDTLGYATRYTYDAAGNLVALREKDGALTTYAYDEAGNLVRETDAIGRETLYMYDAAGQLVQTSRPCDGCAGGVAAYTTTYDTAGRAVLEVDARGGVVQTRYDVLGRPAIVTQNVDAPLFARINFQPAGTAVPGGYLPDTGQPFGDRGNGFSYGWEMDMQPYARDRNASRSPDQRYDTLNHLSNSTGEHVWEIAVPDGLYEVHLTGGDPAYVDSVFQTLVEGQPLLTGAASDGQPWLQGTRLVSVDDGRLTLSNAPGSYYSKVNFLEIYAVEPADGLQGARWITTTFAYDPAGRLIQEVDAAGAVSLFDYDRLGRLITTTNALGYQTVQAYDAVGNRVQVVNGRGYTTAYTYDRNDRLLTVTDALGSATTHTYDAAGRLVSTTNPLGLTTTFSYDANGNQIGTTDPRGSTSATLYDALNRPMMRLDPLGSSSQTGYDVMGRVVSETNALGYTTVYTYDAVGRRVAERSPLGHVTTFTYDSADNQVTRTDAGGAVWQYAYDANGNQVSRTNPLGHVWHTTYDLLNRATLETDPLGAQTRSAYDDVGNLVRQTDPRGAVTAYTYDALGQRIQETDALGFTITHTFNAAGSVVRVRDGRGFTTHTVFDALERAIAQIDPLGQTRHTVYDAAGQVLAEVDYSGQATAYVYDAGGNQIQIIDALNHTIDYAFDPLNRVVSVTDPLGNVSETGYDAAGQVISRTTAAGHMTLYRYDAAGRQVTQINPLGDVWTTSYDALGRPVQQTDALGRTTTTAYDAVGQVMTETDALNRPTGYVYDPLGRLLAVIGPDGTTQRYTYDPTGNRLTEQDGRGQTTRTQYDLRNQVRRTIDPLGRMWVYQYDGSGNQIALVTPGGSLIAQSYDALNRLQHKAVNGGPVLQLAYDANGNRTVMTDTLGVTLYQYDALNRLLASTDGNGRSVHYVYDALGRQTSLTYPDGAVATYTYDADGNLILLTAPDGATTQYVRDALGRPTRVTQGNGVTIATTYDAVGNSLQIEQQEAGGALFARHTYTVDDADRRVRLVETLPQGSVTTTYAYDALDRLTDSAASDGRETHYSFDRAGNRLTMSGFRQTGAGLAAFALTYGYNAANQLVWADNAVLGLTTYTYDADGNRTGQAAAGARQTYAYDAESRLLEARVEQWDGSAWVPKQGVYEQYAYDGNGRRVSKATLSAASDTLISERVSRYDDVSQWHVLQTFDADNARFLYDDYLHKLAYWDGSGAGYLQHDGLGSVLGGTNANGALDTPTALMRYDDYGAELEPGSLLPTDDGYTGYEVDGYTELDYGRYRYYDAATGTFLTKDPYPADDRNPGSLHRYLYVQANPVNYTDPLGLFRWTSASSGIIETGDTLWSVASAYWRVSPTNVSWQMISAIQQANPWMNNVNLIHAGQTLVLPNSLSAYKQTAYSNAHAVSSGTDGSSCGNPNPSNPDTPPPSDKTPPSCKNCTSNSTTVVDQQKSSVAWNLFWSVSEGQLKANSRRYDYEFDKSFYVPPIPPIGYSGGKGKIEFEYNVYGYFRWTGEKAVRGFAATGWCGGIGADAKLEASIPLAGPVRVGAWGGINGEIGACSVGKWINANTLHISLQPYGRISGEIGAKIFVGNDWNKLGLDIELEAGVEGVANAEATNTKSLDVWFEAGPYFEASAEAKVLGRKFSTEYEWRGLRYESPRKSLHFANIFR